MHNNQDVWKFINKYKNNSIEIYLLNCKKNIDQPCQYQLTRVNVSECVKIT